MERILNVSLGYLKFTFSAMLASAVVFSLIGLGITSPRVCSVVIILGIGAFFVVKGELNTRRRHREARTRNNDQDFEKESINQWVAFTQTALIVASLAVPENSTKVCMVLTEWTHKFDTGRSPEEDELSSARKSIDRHREDLERSGFRLAFIAKLPIEDFIASFRQSATIAKINVVQPFPTAQYPPGNPNIVMGFIVMQRFLFKPEDELEKILAGSFDLVKGTAPNPSELHKS